MTTGWLGILSYTAMFVVMMRTFDYRPSNGWILTITTLILLSLTMIGEDRLKKFGRVAFAATLGLVLVVQWFIQLVSLYPLFVRFDEGRLQTYKLLVLAMGVVMAWYAVLPRFLPRLRFPVLGLLFLGLVAWIVHVCPRPYIDVWDMQQDQGRNLLEGKNPYNSTFANPYKSEEAKGLIAPELMRDGRVFGYHYPPLSVILSAAAVTVGDNRWLNGLATVGFGWCAIWLARRRGLPAGHYAELLPAALFCLPRTAYLIEHAWTEPQMAFFAALACVLVERFGESRGASGILGQGLGVAGIVSIKQHGILFLPSLLSTGRLSWKGLLTGFVVSGLIVLPFAILDFDSLWFGNVKVQSLMPFRYDSLSFASWLANEKGIELPPYLGMVAAAVGACLALRPGSPIRKNPGLSAAIVYFSLYAWSRGFLNYYWFVGALLLLGTIQQVATFLGQERGSTPEKSDPAI